MNPSSSFSSIFSIFDNLEIDEVTESFSTDSVTLAGHSWELKDLLNNDDNVGSDCPNAEGGPANEAGWKCRFGMC